MLKFNPLLKTLLVLNGLLEAGFGLFLLLKPADGCNAMGCENIDSQSLIMLAGMYGGAALSIGLLSFRLSFIDDNSATFRACVWAFAIFHFGLALNQLVRSPDIVTFAIHGVLGLLFVACAVKLASIKSNIQ